jgi:hypothetical protein
LIRLVSKLQDHARRLDQNNLEREDDLATLYAKLNDLGPHIDPVKREIGPKHYYNAAYYAKRVRR